MKKIIIGLLCGLVVIFGICYNTKKIQNQSINNNVINRLKYEDIQNKNVIITSSTTDKYLNEDFSNLFINSDAVVKGTVTNVEYIAIEGNAWTKISLKISDVYKGNLSSLDEIDVYFIGGYITLDDHIAYFDDSERFSNIDSNIQENTVLKEVIDSEDEFVSVDEELILCLVETLEESPLPNGSYERLYAAGMLKKQEDMFVQLYGESEYKYSISTDKTYNIKNIDK